MRTMNATEQRKTAGTADLTILPARVSMSAQAESLCSVALIALKEKADA